MDKRSKNILFLFGAALLVIIVIEIARPKPVNWNSSYTSSDKIPLGSYVLFEELKDHAKFTDVHLITKSPFEFLSQSDLEDNSAYLFINSSLSIDKRSYEKLIDYVQEGNSIFLAAQTFGTVFQDSLQIETATDYGITEEDITPTFFSSFLKKDSLPKFKKKVYRTVFKNFDTTKTTALGYFKNDIEDSSLEEINFIKVKKGKGNMYFHTLPEAFSNYYILKGNSNYTTTCLSFLGNADTIYWDDYLKDGRKIVDSPMRFVLNKVPLRWAYYLLMVGILIFIIFKGKREQRIIPVIEPLKNTSVEFTQTIGDLYFQYKDYGDIISKKITYFLEKIRSSYYINTNILDADFIAKLAVKTSHSLEETKELIDYINILKSKAIHTEEDLIKLNKKIEEFTI